MNNETAALTLEDRLAINDVLMRYATGIDRRDWALFRTCFTDGFIGEYGDFGSWSSGDEITAAMEASHAQVGATLHRITNVVATATAAGAATARSYVDAVLMPQATGGPVYQAVGYYDDRLIRTGGTWRLRHRHFIMAWFRNHHHEVPVRNHNDDTVDG